MHCEVSKKAIFKRILGLHRSKNFTYVDDAVIGNLPARLQPQDIESARLLGAEVGQGRVRHMVGLEVELEQGRKQLCHGTHALVGHIDAVVNGQRG